MEHRYHARMDADIPALIYRCGIPVATARVRDASRGGVFLSTSYAELRPNQHLEVEFPLDDSGSDAMRRLRAQVRRCERTGVALELDDRDAAVAPSMRALLRQLLDHGVAPKGPAAAMSSAVAPAMER